LPDGYVLQSGLCQRAVDDHDSICNLESSGFLRVVNYENLQLTEEFGGTASYV
jgi:hypothetical protein